VVTNEDKLLKTILQNGTVKRHCVSFTWPSHFSVSPMPVSLNIIKWASFSIMIPLNCVGILTRRVPTLRIGMLSSATELHTYHPSCIYMYVLHTKWKFVSNEFKTQYCSV